MITDKIYEVLEDNPILGFEVNDLGGGEYELLTYTALGVNMLYYLTEVEDDETFVENFVQAVREYDYDEEIRLLKEYPSSEYSKAFSYFDAVDDFRELEGDIEKVITLLEEVIGEEAFDKDEKIFEVGVSYEEYGTLKLKAKSYGDLVNKLSNRDYLDELPLPDNEEYVQDSFKIDYENIKEKD